MVKRDIDNNDTDVREIIRNEWRLILHALSSPEKGRFLVATRRIESLELVFKEDPVVIGPSRQHKLVCLECLDNLKEPYLCPKCRFPACNENCALNGKWHAKLECKFFQERNFKAASIQQVPPEGRIHKLLVQIASITPLRFLLQNEILQFEADVNLHYINNSRKDMVHFLEKDIISTILEDFGADFDETAVAKANPITPARIEVRALRRIEKDEEITTRYVGSNVGLPSRRLMLYEHWGFICLCSRCIDPTEFSTYTSALKCLKCKTGFYLPPVEFLKEWKCNNCCSELSNAKVGLIIEENVNKINIIMKRSDVKVTFETLRKLIETLGEYFHENHFLISQVKYVLMLMLSNATSSLTNDNFTYWSELNEICFTLLTVLDRLDPGYSKNRGKVLKEYIGAYVGLAEVERSSERINETEFNRRKAFAQNLGRELVFCYKHEKFQHRKMHS